MELVIDYAAPRRPLLQAETKRLPHIYAGRLDAFPLPASQLSSEVFVQRLFLPFPSHPQGLAGFQIAHYCEKLVLLSPVNLIHSHLLERRLAAMLVPPLEVAHVDSPHSGLRQLESPSHLTSRRTFTGLTDYLFEPLAERRLGRQLLDLFHSDSAFRTPQAMHFHHYRRPIYAPWQIPDFTLAHIIHSMQSSPTPTTLKPPVDRLAPDPQFQCLRLFVQLVPIYPIPRPSQDRCPFFVCQPTSVAKNAVR